jgi:4-hydroxysphinganine ceramide fatty acyl 2-hydroxylase
MDGYELKGTWIPDYNKGILWQIWTSEITFEQYVEFVTEPKLLINPVRDVILFNTPFLEIFSKTSWYAIPIAWFPFIFYYLSLNESDFIGTIFYILFGVLLWTLLEYTIHRFCFHGEDKWLPRNNKSAFVAHFLLHGIHHAFP